LTGAVSVPIYYTTPEDEIALLLMKSGAHWFFVGDERIRQNLNKVPSDVKIIPFGPLDENPKEKVVELTGSLTHATFSPDSLATIRYTSGTTGEPKGVMFNFSQLKWMGEVLTNLLSWSDRNSEMRYLSFLPESHVVEGILAAYAPYCMLCKAKIYYLNDFTMLTKALPQVRPTVFFSVPRFYEKLWEQLEQSSLGEKFLTMNNGWMKRLTGNLLRRALLRKAGLDKCSQLIVGSAPISEELLLRFRDLGVEIHNAYGLTEAPLVTINRLGDNVIPSIGTPLPDTAVTISPDGELIVRGPQVAKGYYQLENETFQNGELHTGDLGRIGTDGHIYIGGRKKDMLITSYGKNINCTKIEQLLTDIPCVGQAVLVGEQRPYCTALLWTVGSTDFLQQEIERMNQSLSHPEQIKRWRIIETPLTIMNNELTPNLKVKRNIVLEHFKQVIDEMYAD
jgi:long-chain acyl-CoA synthetase